MSESTRSALVDPPEGGDALAGRRIVIAGEGPTAGPLAEALRAQRAQVATTPATAKGIGPAHLLDPEVVVVAGASDDDWVQAVRRDSRLRWAIVLEIDREGEDAPDVEALVRRIGALVAQDRRLTQRAAAEARLEVKLESIGPGRMLRALAASGEMLHVTVQGSRCVVEMDVTADLLISASAVRADGTPMAEGAGALAVLLGLETGSVVVERRANAMTMNVMLPIEQALAAGAAGESAAPAEQEPVTERPTVRMEAVTMETAAALSAVGPSVPPEAPEVAASPSTPAEIFAAAPEEPDVAAVVQEAHEIAAVAREADEIATVAPAVKEEIAVVPPEPVVAVPPRAVALPPRTAAVAAPTASRRSFAVPLMIVVAAAAAIGVWVYRDRLFPAGRAAETGVVVTAPPDERVTEDVEAPVRPQAPEAEGVAADPEPTAEAEALPASRAERVDELLERGERNRRAGLLDEAAAHYERALVLDSRAAQAHAGLAAIALERLDAPGAHSHAAAAVAARPRRARYRVLLGDAHAIAGDRARAESEWRRALEIDPDDRDAARRLRVAPPSGEPTPAP